MVVSRSTHLGRDSMTTFGANGTPVSDDELSQATQPEGTTVADRPDTATLAARFAEQHPEKAIEPILEDGDGTEKTTPGTDIEVTRLGGELVKSTWEHDFLEFQGDKLEIRVPQQQALAAYSLAMSPYVPPKVRNDISGMFVVRHLSAESYGVVMSRLMDPDDPDYSVETLGELMGAIVNTALPEITETIEKDAKASK
ncbi:hypothetical protein SEA_NEOS5_27 [Mycobacterium phage Neos5]|uniref:tail assembly chaperone n=1 Tax=Mycobacterium phage Phlyer TaxID=591487 RepID=UPI00019231F0|nr:tail assembly chaperone [Mycobacterium phage Phlyer]ACM42191.1 hypothetical protein PHLYER_27 [Mycobacterium phage Phlyer]AHN84244.1 hypothetical protein HEATHCLIFF_27 [Mycobacterium phage Heathcliff]AVR55947.1 hypothetical protein SEA_YAHALOM_27 [Mycobacterium phage Yahalom]QYW01640.1 hypothetical protein SEA_NEOS5_27 [Mycobacterium phage Neos5]